MNSNIIVDLIDLSYLEWGKQRNSSGTAGTFLKAYSIDGSGHKLYYKMSCFDEVNGIIGHESVNELIASRILDVLGFPHVKYDLIHANVFVNERKYNTYIAVSEDYKKMADKKIALDMYYGLYKNKSETPFEFMCRLGYRKFMAEMAVFDFIIANRDRHGANIEIIKNTRTKDIKISPLFDHGVSLLFCLKEKSEFENADVMADYKVQSFIGSSSLYQNLSLFSKEDLPGISSYDKKIEEYIFNKLDGIIPEYHIRTLKNMIKRRWEYYENFYNTR